MRPFRMNMKTVTLFFHLLVLIYSGLVQASEDVKPPIIRCQPKNDVITYTNFTYSIFIPCEAEGENVKNPSHTYQWKKDDVEIQATMEHISKIKDCNFGLNIKPTENSAGKYQCFVSNKHGIAMSNPVTLQKYEFNSSCAPQTATVGTSLKLTCVDSQNLAGLEQNYWAHEKLYGMGVQITPIIEDSRRILDPHGNLWLLSVQQDDSSTTVGSYVYVTRDGQSHHNFCETTLHVVNSSTSTASYSDPPKKYSSDENEFAVWGENEKLYCIYDKRFNIVWKKDNQILESNGENVKISISQRSIEIKNFQEENEGKYTCEVRKPVNNEIEYTHHFNVKIGKPFFKKELEKLEIIENRTATLHCEAHNSKTSQCEMSIRWIYNSEPITETVFYDEIQFSQNDSVLEIENCQEKHIGTYGCNASNIHGFVYKEGYIYVQKGQLPERDESIEYNANEIISRNVGDILILTCPVKSAFPKTDMRIEWRKNDNEKLSNETDVPRITIEEDEKFLYIRNVTFDDAEEYKCIVYYRETEYFNFTFNFVLNPEPNTKESNTTVTIFLWLIGLLVISAIVLAILIIGKKRGVYYLRETEHEIANQLVDNTPEQNEVAQAESTT